MSTIGKRDFRPNLHFSPAKNWTNDPNGLIYINGVYHLFYQHYPEKPVWGSMHWAHATSKDMLSWEHKEIALYPDELGTIFSGSAVLDVHNTSGFGTNETPAMVAIYTSHGDFEQQCIAYSLDGINFTKYAENPVIKNSSIVDFRDPKVFWYEKNKCWIMALSAGDKINFYSSKNLKEWQKTGEFGPEGNYCTGCFECPDLISFDTEDGEKWVLIISMGMGFEHGGARTQYFIGSFDGEKFTSDNCFTKPEFIDSGFDNYAGVTFSNLDENILIGWGVNPQYADKTPTGEFCGIMTLPRRLNLVKNEGKYNLTVTPWLPKLKNVNAQKICKSFDLTSEVFALEIKGNGKCEIRFLNEANQTLIFGINEDGNIFINREKAGDTTFSSDFATELYSIRKIERLKTGNYSMLAIFDVSSFELFVDEGLRSFSNVVYPDLPYNKIEVDGTIEAFIKILK